MMSNRYHIYNNNNKIVDVLKNVILDIIFRTKCIICFNNFINDLYYLPY